MKRLLAILLCSSLCCWGSAALAQTEVAPAPPRQPAPTQRFIFGEEVVDANRDRPLSELVQTRQIRKLPPLIKVRTDFTAELVKAGDSL